MLQFFTDPVGCGIGHMNHMANKHVTATDQPNHRRRETDSILLQQKHLMAINNYLCQEKAGQPGSILNPNAVSTGLKLSYEEEEHNSSVTSASENLKAVLPVISSVSNNLKIEIDRQKEEFDQYIKFQVLHVILQIILMVPVKCGTLKQCLLLIMEEIF